MKNLFALLMLIACGIYSCNNDDDECPKSPTPGTGGSIRLSGYVKHHALAIPYARVFIEFGAAEFPGSDTAAYDASTTADASAYYELNGLKSGDYYLYSVGFDSAIALPVVGGVPVEICEGIQNIQKNIPVTED